VVPTSLVQAKRRLDIAEQAGRSDVVAWLVENGAIHGNKAG
jgi:hypothetical protein